MLVAPLRSSWDRHGCFQTTLRDKDAWGALQLPDVEWLVDVCGLSVDTQDAIMDPHFTYLRISNSCLSWVRDTIGMRYAGLHVVGRSSRWASSMSA